MGALAGVMAASQAQNNGEGTDQAQGQQGPFNYHVAGQLLAGGMPFSNALMASAELTRNQQMMQYQAQKAQLDAMKDLYTPATNSVTGEQYSLADQLAARGIGGMGMPAGSPATQGSQGGAPAPQPMPSPGMGVGNMTNGAPMSVPGGGMASIPPNSPLMGMNPKQIMDQKGEDFKYLDQLKQDSSATVPIKQSINAYQNALSKFQSGFGAQSKAAVGSASQSLFGTDLGTNPAAVQYAQSQGPALVGQFLHGIRASEPIIKYFENAVPGPDKEPAANQAILDQMSQKVNDTQQKFLAASAYQKMYGTTKGFDEKWLQYTNDPNARSTGDWGQAILGQSLNPKQGANNAQNTQPSQTQTPQPVQFNLQDLLAEKARRQGKK